MVETVQIYVFYVTSDHVGAVVARKQATSEFDLSAAERDPKVTRVVMHARTRFRRRLGIGPHVLDQAFGGDRLPFRGEQRGEE
ncbi:hypothetical protein CC117_30205 [Parafrankia colletiae]|uniref:Uncharacterized protein n=1 Tax=Parafrankia colletiae TaxID=573497 RepID=A0A1S1Q4X0_9ACTN|nr:hypothetical protein CC117_30205 [Parafrankia colletiae]